MSDERPTFAEIGEQNVRQYLRRRCDEHIRNGGVVGMRVPVLEGVEGKHD